MRLPAETASSWIHIAFSAFTWASLTSWSEYEDLALPARGELGGFAGSLKAQIDTLLREARETQDEVLFGRPIAKARRNCRLMALRRRLAGALAWLTDLLGGSRQHPSVREFLPGLLSGVNEAPAEERPRLVQEAAARLAGVAVGDAEEPTQARERHVIRLRDAAARAQEAIGAAETAHGAWRTERSEEVVEKGRLRLELERVHRSLGALFPGQNEFVESFFLRGERPSEGGGEEVKPEGEGEESGKDR